ncbi:MAG: hypothetical protein ACXVQ7_09395 [Actinomycetota bacterium]
MPRLLVTYPDRRAAREAVRALEMAGIPHSEIQVDTPIDERDELRAEQHDEANAAAFGPCVLATGATKRAAVGGSAVGSSVVGIPIGAIIGLIVGVIFFPHQMLGMLASIVGFGVAAWVTLALRSMFSAATEEQEAQEEEQQQRIIVGVHARTTKEIERAQGALRGTEPKRVHIAY